MRLDSAQARSRMIRLEPAIEPSPAGPEARRAYRVDVLIASTAMLTLVEHFRARANYASCPVLAMILPALLCVASASYRRRVGAWCRSAWSRLDDYSRRDGPIPWVAAFAFVVGPVWLLYLSNGLTLGAIDTRPVVPTAISLVTEGNWELGEYFQPGRRKVSLLDGEGHVPLCFQVRPGGIYSTYPGGMVPFASAVVGLGAVLEANLDNVETQRHLEKMTSALVAAASVGLFFLIALRLAAPGPAWVSTLILAVGSGVWSTASMGLWQHGGLIFWSMAMLLMEFRHASEPRFFASTFQGLACAQLVSCRLTSVAILVPFGAWVLIRNPRRAMVVVGSAVLAFLPWTWAYLATYGSPFGPSTGVLAGGLWSAELGGPLLGVLVSPARGMLVYQAWILLPAALAIAPVRERLASQVRASSPVGWGFFCLAAIVAQVGLISAWGCWWGGWCWGSRLVVDVIPLCALLCVRPIAALWTWRWGRGLVVVLGLLGFLAQVPAVSFHATRWNATADFPRDAWSWSRPPFLEWHLGP